MKRLLASLIAALLAVAALPAAAQFTQSSTIFVTSPGGGSSSGITVGDTITGSCTSGYLLYSNSGVIGCLGPVPSLTGTPAAGDISYWTSPTAQALLTSAASSSGSFMRSTGSGSAPTWSTLILPDVAANGTIFYCTAGNVCVAGPDPTLGLTGGTTGTLTFKHTSGSGSITISPANPSSTAYTLTLPAATDTLAGKATTDTFTNKTIDAEGTGNSITIPVKVWLPAAGCNNATASSFWDLPTSTPAVAACVTGSNTQKGVLQYADTSGGFSAQNSILLPADFSGAVDARIIWRTGATSGNAKFSLSTICTAVDASETDDPAFNTASTVTTSAPGTANRLQTSAITGLTTTGCAAGEYMHLKLFRDGNDGSDTLGASLEVIGVELTIRRAM